MKIIIYKTRCGLCGKIFQGLTEAACIASRHAHLEANECSVARHLREWIDQSVYTEMFGLLPGEELERKIRNLLKDYSADEIREGLEQIEHEAVPG